MRAWACSNDVTDNENSARKENNAKWELLRDERGKRNLYAGKSLAVFCFFWMSLFRGISELLFIMFIQSFQKVSLPFFIILAQYMNAFCWEQECLESFLVRTWCEIVRVSLGWRSSEIAATENRWQPKVLWLVTTANRAAVGENWWLPTVRVTIDRFFSVTTTALILWLTRISFMWSVYFRKFIQHIVIIIAIITIIIPTWRHFAVVNSATEL